MLCMFAIAKYVIEIECATRSLWNERSFLFWRNVTRSLCYSLLSYPNHSILPLAHTVQKMVHVNWSGEHLNAVDVVRRLLRSLLVDNIVWSACAWLWWLRHSQIPSLYTYTKATTQQYTQQPRYRIRAMARWSPHINLFKTLLVQKTETTAAHALPYG